MAIPYWVFLCPIVNNCNMINESIILQGPRYGLRAMVNDQRNKEILLNNLNAFKDTGKPRVGDMLKLPNGLYTRFTYDWGDSIQTGGSPGNAFYLGEGYYSYSGSLNPGIVHGIAERTDETLPGELWFFSCRYAGADCGVYYTIPYTVWKIKEGTPNELLKGLWMDSTGSYSGNFTIEHIKKLFPPLIIQ